MKHRPPLPHLLLVLISFGLFGWAYHEILWTVVFLLILGWSYFHRRTLPWPDSGNRVKYTIWGTVALVFCSVYVWFFYSALDPFGAAVRGLMLMAVSVWVWHLPPSHGKKPWLVVGTTSFIALSAGATLRELPRLPFILGLACYAVLLVWVVCAAPVLRHFQHLKERQEKTRHIIWISCCALLLTSGTWYGSLALNSASQGVVRFLMSLDDPTVSMLFQRMGTYTEMAVGYRSAISLTQEIHLTVTGTAPPGYLRTQVLTRYENNRWKRLPATDPTFHWEPLQDAYAIPGAVEQNSTPLQDRQLDIFVPMSGAVPLPYGTTQVIPESGTRFALTDGNAIRLRSDSGLRTIGIQTVFTPLTHPASRRTEGLDSNLFAEAGRIPADIKPDLEPIARAAIGKTTFTNLEAAAAIEHYFQENYAYALEVNLSDKGNPMVDFIRNRKPAFCKYFASGMVLLLRSVGVPARVAVGYFSREYNRASDSWIVREADGHVWCEVYDPERDLWVAFDPTPPSVLTTRQESGFKALLETCKNWLKVKGLVLYKALRTTNLLDWPVIGWKALKAFISWRSVALLLGMAGMVFLYRNRDLWRFQWALSFGFHAPPAKSKETAHQEALRVCFDQVAQALAGAGMPLRETETLAEFCIRHSLPKTHPLAVFFERYAACRFSTHLQTDRKNLEQQAEAAIIAVTKEF
ncbi:MAG: transglutaminase-like domain-containing protein [Blastocatellia bacterium]|nr:transglutaminase-like domain-containing protein [Blastocatellia bacterium]